MLRHTFEPLEGSNILWHIVGPPHPPHPFSLSFLEHFTRFSLPPFGWTFDSTRQSRGMAKDELKRVKFSKKDEGVEF